MEVNLEKEAICVNRQVATKKEIIYVQGDMIVPDSKPDILNTINTSGNVAIYKKEILDGKIRIDGNINTYIMYFADNENDNVRGLNTTLDFSETLMIPECKQGMIVWVNSTVKSIDTKVLNGRKISIRVGVEVQSKIYSKENIKIVSKINDNDIRVLEKTVRLNSEVGEGSNSAIVKDTIAIDNKEQLAEILKVDVNLVDKDIKLSYNKILAKAEAEIKVMYLTEDNQIKVVQSQIPLVGFVDIQNVSEENICDVCYEMKNIVIKPNTADEYSIYVEIETQISCIAYEEKDINLIEDLYSMDNKMIINSNEIDVISNKQQRKEMCEIRERAKIGDSNKDNLIDVDILPNIVKKSKSNTKILYEGEMALNFIFENNVTNGINNKMINLPFEFTIDNIDNAESLEDDLSIEIARQDFAVQDNGDVECSVDLSVNADMYRNEQINVIEGVDVEPDDELEDYSVIVYIVKKGDTLWKIAKKFRSTVDDIVRMNGIENPDFVDIGQKIYIPKYAKTSSVTTASA